MTTPKPELPGLMSYEAARTLVETLKQAGKRVAFVNGCFDVMHVGHVRLLQAAADVAEYVIVGLSSDVWVRHRKGACRPILEQSLRAEMLLALKYVDAVVIMNEEMPFDLISMLKPDIVVKGGRFSNTDKMHDVLRGFNGRCHEVARDGWYSTSATIEIIRFRYCSNASGGRGHGGCDNLGQD